MQHSLVQYLVVNKHAVLPRVIHISSLNISHVVLPKLFLFNFYAIKSI